MKISTKTIQFLKTAPNSAYNSLKTEFLYHSNKLEGSTFTKENLQIYLEQAIVEGNHHIDDILETTNSTELFDFVVETLGEPLNKRLIQEFHRMLKDKTSDHKHGFAGRWKRIPNMITGANLTVAQPWEVEEKIEILLNKWNSSDKGFNDVMTFHAEFEHIHPFQDGNGRVGRFIMLKQCIENDIDLILIDDEYSKKYKSALNIAQTENDYSQLSEIFTMCQNYLESKLGFLSETLKYFQEYEVDMDEEIEVENNIDDSLSL